jgi:hypothetical protein
LRGGGEGVIADDPLDYFGQFVVENLRDRALENFELMTRRHWKAPALQNLQNALAGLPEEHQAVCRRVVRRVIDSAIHDLLFAVQEQHETSGRLTVEVDGRSVAELSDGLQGEPYTEEGWYARFSRFGNAQEVE